MTVKESISQLINDLPLEWQQQVLDYARFLSMKDEFVSWREQGQWQFSRVFGTNEPEHALT